MHQSEFDDILKKLNALNNNDLKALLLNSSQQLPNLLSPQASKTYIPRKEYDDFVYLASHELNAPLRGIKTLVQFLKDDLSENTDEEILENLALLNSRVQKSEHIVEDLLRLSRAGRDFGEKEIIDIQSVIDGHSCAEQIDLIGLKQIEFYPAEFEQILNELLENSVFHNSNEVQIRIEVKKENERTVFVYQDNGEGIPESFQEKIWKPFTFLKPYDQTLKTGIGMAVVHKIVQCTEGEIQIEHCANPFKIKWIL